jgi:hypothetical protein
MSDVTLAPDRAPGRRTNAPASAPEELAEQHLMRRILIATAIAVPVGALFFFGLVAAAMVIAGQPVLVASAMGAGIGVLAGAFFGMWAGFVASVSELDRADVHLEQGSEAPS